MSLAIVWSNNAEFTFDSIIKYIENFWGENSARKFVVRANQMLLNLSEHPYLYKSISVENNVRIGIITPQVSVVYKIHLTHIYLLYFWDNQQQPLI